MQGIRFRILLISFFASICFSTPVDQSNKQPHGTNNASRCQSQIPARNVQLMTWLHDIALYTYENRGTFINLLDNLDKNILLNDKWKNSSALNPQSKEFMEEILKKIDEAVREYKSLDDAICNSNKQNSSDQSTEFSDQGNITTTTSRTQNNASNINLSPDKNSGNSRDTDHKTDGKNNDTEVMNAFVFGIIITCSVVNILVAICSVCFCIARINSYYY